MRSPWTRSVTQCIVTVNLESKRSNTSPVVSAEEDLSTIYSPDNMWFRDFFNIHEIFQLCLGQNMFWTSILAIFLLLICWKVHSLRKVEKGSSRKRKQAK